MTFIENSIKYRCLLCIFNIIDFKICDNNCESYKCLACNTTYHYKYGNIYFGHDPKCFKSNIHNMI
jgi:hypothetical protein